MKSEQTRGQRATAAIFAIGAGSLVLFGQWAHGEDLGIIRVDSTTIDDRFDNKRQEPSNIGVIRGEEIDRSHPENIQQILQRIPGITTEVQSGDSLKIHIRGVENQVYMGEKPGVAVVIDGVPVFERTGRVNIDLDNIESIKVVKGGASYLFGDDALAGAVIITTKRGANYAGYKAAGETGSFGYRKGLVRAGLSGESLNGLVQASSRQSEGYYEDSDYRADYVNGKLQYYVDDVSDITFGVERAERQKNSHGSVRGVTAAENDPKSEDPAYNDYANHFEVSLAKYYATYSRDFSDTGNLLFNVYHYGDDTQFDSAPLKSDPDVYSQFNDYAQVQRGVKTEYRAGSERVAYMAALDVRANRYDSKTIITDCSERVRWDPTCATGNLSNSNVTDEAVRAVYGELKYRISGPLSLTFNGRIDNIELDYSDRLDPEVSGDKRFDVSSWRVGANYALAHSLDVYSNISTGFRAPSAGQLFVGSNTPTMRVDPNPDLEPEKAVNMELGLRHRAKWFGVPTDLDLAVFQIDRTDHIQATAGQYTTGSDNRYENVGDVRHRGLELSAASDPGRKVSVELAYTYLDAYYTSYDTFNLQTCNAWRFGGSCAGYELTPYDNTGNQVPRVPHHHANVLMRYRAGSHWTISGEVDAVSDYYADEINQIKIGGHEVFNLLVNYDRRVGGVDWTVFARIDNLLDRDYYNTVRGHGDTNEDGVYDEEDLSIVVNQGRTFYAGVSAGF